MLQLQRQSVMQIPLTCSFAATTNTLALQRRCNFQLITTRGSKLVVEAAKKGGDKKGKGPKKGALADLMQKKEAARSASTSSVYAQRSQYDNPDVRMLAFQMCDSYWRLTKKYLIEGVDFDRLASALYRAPFVLLAHNKFQEGVTDPIYIYGNRAALELFDITWDELIVTPSRKSAADDPATQQDRNELVEKAAKTGLLTGFEVWRVSKSGRRFKIKDGTLFNIMDRQGNNVGQAAVFNQVELEDGTLVEIKGMPEDDADAGPVLGPVIPSPEEIGAAEKAVAEQAAHVRSLKETQGMSNQDIPVQLAVLELKKRKEKLASLQKQVEEALQASKAAFDDDDE